MPNASDRSVMNQIGNAHFGSGQAYVSLENYQRAKQFFEYALDDYIRSKNEDMINLCNERIEFCEYYIQKEKNWFMRLNEDNLDIFIIIKKLWMNIESLVWGWKKIYL